MFKLIERSNKAGAKQFSRWVRHEVLPQVMDNPTHGEAHSRRCKACSVAGDPPQGVLTEN
ncbi:hypothetical protein EOD43_17410 [Sphingomonas crocodyli]|uniref:Bro-N domain-containing protein n=1 Tax=Sphingomonas crocodyli TaxID=1979270 RepID=A0A437M187_9SPHN|nr:hypothetical protein EOD43_17410 [Sphingomonas crocodyli]